MESYAVFLWNLNIFRREASQLYALNIFMLLMFLITAYDISEQDLVSGGIFFLWLSV